MKLQNCLEVGWICGLKTVGEAFDNIASHVSILFPYEEINKQELELESDLIKYKLDDNITMNSSKIKEVLWNLFSINTDDIDKELKEDLERLDNELKERTFVN